MSLILNRTPVQDARIQEGPVVKEQISGWYAAFASPVRNHRKHVLKRKNAYSLDYVPADRKNGTKTVFRVLFKNPSGLTL